MTQPQECYQSAVEMRDCVKNDRNLLVFSVGIIPVTAINDAGIDVSHQIAVVPKAERSEVIGFELHRGTGYAEATRTPGRSP